MSETSEELEARIAAYIDGQLPSAEAARLEVFLANTDPQLAEQIIGMLADRHRLRSLPRGVAPADLAGRVMEQVERSSLLNDVDSASQWRRPWWQSRRWGAVAALLMVGVFTYFVVMAVVGTGYNQRIRDMVANAGKPVARPVAPRAERPVSTEEVDKSGARDMGKMAMGKNAGGGAGGVEKDATALASAMGKEGPARREAMKGGFGGGGYDEKARQEVAVQEQLQRQREITQNGVLTAKKLGYTAVDSASKALASISVGSAVTGGEPVVLTLVARDERDYLRLQQALVELINQDPAMARRQAVLQTRLANGTVTFANQAVGGNGAANGTGGLTNQYAVNGGVGQAASTVGNNVGANKTDQQLNKAVANSDGNVNLNGNNDQMYQVYNSGQQRFDAVAEANTAALNGAAGNSVNITNATGPAPSQVAASTVGEKSQGTGQEGQAVGGQQTQVAAGPVGPPFRVELRAEQLQRLAAQFEVNSVTCGQQAFVIAADKNGALARGGASLRDDSAQKKVESGAAHVAGKADESLSVAAAGARSTPPAPAAPAAGPAAADNDRRPATIATKEGPRQTQSKPAATQMQAFAPNALAPTGQEGQWLECVITMEPQPVKAAADAVVAPAATTQHSK